MNWYEESQLSEAMQFSEANGWPLYERIGKMGKHYAIPLCADDADSLEKQASKGVKVWTKINGWQHERRAEELR